MADHNNAKDAVTAWLNESEGFSLRIERLHEDAASGNDLVPWLVEAFRLGADRAAHEGQVLVEALEIVKEHSDDVAMRSLAKRTLDKHRAALSGREAQPACQQEAVTVADHEAIEIGTISNYYGGLNLKREGGQDFWCIEDWDGMDWEPCDPAVASALRAMEENRNDQ